MKSRAIPYEGNEPYIFLSYCHKDAAIVYPLLEKIVADGYRVWYDDGNRAGDDWRENIANHLTKSTVCLAMVSQNSSESHNCRNEIFFATECNKKLLVVLMEQFQMSTGMKMQLSTQHQVKKYELSSDSALLQKVYETEEIKTCKDNAGSSRLRELTEAEKKENDLALQAQMKKDQEAQAQAAKIASALVGGQKTAAAADPVPEQNKEEPVVSVPSDAEKKKAEQDARIQAMLAEIERLKQEQAEAEKQAAQEAAQKEAARIEAERKAAEEAARKEAERKAAEEAARKLAQQKAEEAAAQEEARIQAMLAEIERLRLAREEANRKAAAEEAARQEAARKAAEEAARREAERKAAEEAARKEAERRAAQEAAEKAARENDRIQAMLAEIERLKKEAEEAARKEAERIAREQAKRRRQAAEEEARALCDSIRSNNCEDLRVYADRQKAANQVLQDPNASDEKKIEAEEFQLSIYLKERANLSKTCDAARHEAERLKKAADSATGEEKELLLLKHQIVYAFYQEVGTEDSALDLMLSNAYRQLEEKRRKLEEKRKAEAEAARKAAEEAARREEERKAAIREQEKKLMAELERLRAGLKSQQTIAEDDNSDNKTIIDEDDDGEVTVYGDPGEMTVLGDGDDTVMDDGECTVVQPKPKNLAILLQPSTGKYWLLTATQTKLGRSANHCDIVIEGSHSISKQHADVILMNGKSFLRDAGSANGTYLGTVRLDKDQQLEDVALFKLSDEALILLSGSAAVTCKQQGFVGFVLNESRTAMMNVTGQGLPLNRYSKWPDGTLGDSKISRKEHAYLRMEADGMYLDDLSDPMKNGTYHNGRKMPNKTSVKLTNGDTIRLGDTTLYPAIFSLKEI